MIYHLNDIICELKIITNLHWGLHPRNHVTALILRKEYLAIFGLRCESTESDQPQKVHLVKIDMSTCITGCPLWLHLCALSAWSIGPITDLHLLTSFLHLLTSFHNDKSLCAVVCLWKNYAWFWELLKGPIHSSNLKFELLTCTTTKSVKWM